MTDRTRLQHLRQFYKLLELLEQQAAARRLRVCHGRMNWPTRGVYFFMENGEPQSDTGTGLRVVRIGTHAITGKSKTTLCNRLSQLRGIQKTGRGNHRGSIFRLIVGTAILARDHTVCDSWGVSSSASRIIRDAEIHTEQQVSKYIGNMPFLWLEINDAHGPDSIRRYIERNSIALLSNLNQSPVEEPSPSWLGHQCDRRRVRASGLWNQNHTDEVYDPEFLNTLDELIQNKRASNI